MTYYSQGSERLTYLFTAVPCFFKLLNNCPLYGNTTLYYPSLVLRHLGYLFPPHFAIITNHATISILSSGCDASYSLELLAMSVLSRDSDKTGSIMFCHAGAGESHRRTYEAQEHPPGTYKGEQLLGVWGVFSLVV